MATRTQKGMEAKKRQLLQYRREKPNLSMRELANLTGLSHSTVERTLKKLAQDERTGTPPKVNKRVEPDVSPLPQEDDVKPSLDFTDTPTPIEDERGLVDRGMDALKGMLGLGDKDKNKSTPPPLTEKLDAKRQAFVNHISPIVALAFMLAAGAIWKRIGPEYAILAPDDETALKIVEPLVRIYARHQSYLAELNPDQMDLGACLFALFGYVTTSLRMYQHIKQEKEAYESGFREYRAEPTAENGIDGAGRRYADGRSDAASNNHGNASREAPGANQPPPNLTEKERREYEALSVLRDRDFASRARRSGQFQ